MPGTRKAGCNRSTHTSGPGQRGVSETFFVPRVSTSVEVHPSGAPSRLAEAGEGVGTRAITSESRRRARPGRRLRFQGRRHKEKTRSTVRGPRGLRPDPGGRVRPRGVHPPPGTDDAPPLRLWRDAVVGGVGPAVPVLLEAEGVPMQGVPVPQGHSERNAPRLRASRDVPCEAPCRADARTPDTSPV